MEGKCSKRCWYTICRYVRNMLFFLGAIFEQFTKAEYYVIDFIEIVHGLENRRPERVLEFESLRFRQIKQGVTER